MLIIRTSQEATVHIACLYSCVLSIQCICELAQKVKRLYQQYASCKCVISFVKWGPIFDRVVCKAFDFRGMV